MQVAGHRRGRLGLALLAGLALVLPSTGYAQDTEATTQEVRLRQLEAEVRALQRQVFPSGDAAGAASSNPVPATSTLTRLDTLEAAVARLTAQNEELSNRLRGIDAKIGTVTPTPPASVAALTAPAPASAPAPAVAPPAVAAAAAPAMPPAAPSRAARASAARIAAVKAVAMPSTGDAAEDQYTYGFKLWQAKFYPEAEQQLQLFLENYPKSSRLSYARNLIGRAYLDDGKPQDAARWFLKNYEADKQGDRAPDSLLYLSQAMVELKDTNRACVALGQFGRDYATEAAGRLQGAYRKARNSLACPG